MLNLNKVLLAGNLTRDPELRYLPSGMAVCEFAIAVNRTRKSSSGEQKEEVLFMDVTAFGKQAELISEYLQKGRAVYVEGYLRREEWTGQDGQKRNKMSTVLEKFQFMDSRPSGGAGAAGSKPAGQDKASGPASPAEKPETPAKEDFNAGDDSIPF